MTPWPNFFVVGAAKSGTTALYHALRAHPDVFLPAVKEPHLYAYLADRSTAGHLYADEPSARRAYAELYQARDGQAAVGDCSATNLVVGGAAEAIARDVPDARIVAILRQPVDRAFSHWSHFVSAGGEAIEDFAKAVGAEGGRQQAGYPFTYRYLGWSRYADQLEPFLNLFGPERVLVHLYDELCEDAEAVVRRTLRFLGVDDALPVPPVGRYNEMPRPRRPRRFALRRRGGATPALAPRDRAELTALFAGEIDRLERLLGRDLSAWR